MTEQRNDVPLADFRVQERVRVRFNEIDGQNIVFNANYLVYADIGVTEYFRAIGEGQPGPDFNQYGTDISETHCEIDYHAPARLDELITNAARISRTDTRREGKRWVRTCRTRGSQKHTKK